MADRRFSDPRHYDNSIDSDDAADGSEGGYTKHHTYIPPYAMMDIIQLRVQLAEARELLLNAMPVRSEAMSVGFTEKTWRSRREWLLNSLKGEEKET